MTLLRKFERFYVVITLLFFANGVYQRAVAEDDRTANPAWNFQGQVTQLVIYMILVPLLIVHWREIRQGLRRSGWILALCALVLFSAAWSSDLVFTARRGILLSGATMFGVYLGSCFDWEEQIDLFGWVSVIAVMGSCFMAIFVPAYGISHDVHSGSVKGLFPHRSIMARQMVFAILTLWLGKPRAIPYWVRYCTIAGAFLLLFFSHAATSQLVMLVCLAAYPVLLLALFSRRRTLPLWVPLAPLVVIGGVLVVSNFDLVLEATGRTATLTGRFPIWNAVMRAISTHPWLGYGYEVFWHRNSLDLALLKHELSYIPPHAHNGYLDILISVGIFGMLIFIAVFLTNISRAISVFRSTTMRGAKWPLLVLLFFVLFNLTESNILRPMTFLWVPFVSIYVSLGLMLAEQRYAANVAPQAVTPDRSRDTRVVGMLPRFGADGFPQ